MRTRLAALCGAGLSLIALAAIHRSGGGPPLYDGECVAPKYALVGSTPGPGSTSATYTLSGLASTQELATPEPNDPQAQMIIGAGTLALAPGAAVVTVTITPIKPPAAPPDGAIDGNVYDFAATSGGHAAPVAPGHPVTVSLEATGSSGPTLTLEHLDGTRWTPLQTFQSGCGTNYDAATLSLGPFALVARGSSTLPGPGSQGGSPGILRPVVVIIVVVALFVLAIVAVRFSRRRWVS